MRDDNDDDDDNHDDDEAPAAGWRRGNNRLTLLTVGGAIGATLATGFFDGWTKIAYSDMTAGERHAIWLAVAFFVAAVIFMPGKRLGWGPRGVTFGSAWFDKPMDGVAFVGGLALGFVLGYLLGRLT